MDPQMSLLMQQQKIKNQTRLPLQHSCCEASVILKAHLLQGRSILNILSRGKLKELRAKGCGGCRSAHLVNTSTLGPGHSTTSMLKSLCLWFLSRALVPVSHG
ncbi:unnamed protein product [Gadus morhua 'NCC']